MPLFHCRHQPHLQAQLQSFQLPRQYRHFVAVAFIGLFSVLVAGCAVKPAQTGPTPEEMVRKQRIDRAEINLNEGLKQYEAGSYEASMKNLLVALDSGVLTVPQQLVARKHMAFIQCLNNRELICKEEFEKAFLLDPKFDLTPAEAGHPTWGPIFRLVRTGIELRKSGKALPAVSAKPANAADRLMAEAMKAYDDADYAKAIKLFQERSKETLSPGEMLQTMKMIAFSYCLTNKMTLCRAEFERILLLDPSFELDPAESGHPSWGPPFRSVKAKQKIAPAKK